MVESDTSGVYDACKCGERARIEYVSTSIRIKCDSCGASTKWHQWSHEAMVEWNKMQRVVK